MSKDQTSRGKTPQPDSPELDEILAEYEIGFVTHGRDVNKHLNKFKQAIHEYYTNKFLEIVDDKLSGFNRNNEAGAILNTVKAELRTAIKQLSKRGEI